MPTTKKVASKTLVIIYCRVSSQRQVEQGHGLDSQELRCRAYAKMMGYEVVASFKDEGVSGSAMNRKGINELLGHLETMPAKTSQEVVVLVDELDRFSRDVRVHFDLKDELQKRGGRLETTTFNLIKDDPDNEFFETMFAARGQWERKKNRLRVISRMKSRLERGYWTFPAAVAGLKIVKEPAHGKVMRRDEPWASLIAEALEGYAQGRFPTHEDMRQFLQQKRLFGKTEIDKNYPNRLLGHSLIYAGYLEYEPWNVAQTKGHHDALISFETHIKIQERLLGRVRTIVRKDMQKDFPLRGSVICDVCNTKLTGQWPKGNGGKYAYYWCRNKDCVLYGKTIAKQKIEDELLCMLEKIKPSKRTVALSGANMIKKWDERMKDVISRHKSIQRDIRLRDDQIRDLVDRAASALNMTAARAYEKRIEELENEKLVFKEKLRKVAPDNFSFRTAANKVTNFLQDPHGQWQTNDLKNQHNVLRMCFNGPLQYHRETGFRTTDFSLTYAFISGKQIPEVTGSGYGRN